MRRLEQQYSELLDEAQNVLGTHNMLIDNALDGLATAIPRSLCRKGRLEADQNPNTNDNVDKNAPSIGIEKCQPGPFPTDKENAPLRKRGEDSPLRKRGKEGQGAAHLDGRQGLVLHTDQGRAQNRSLKEGGEAGATHPAAQSEVGGGVFMPPPCMGQNTARRKDKGNIVKVSERTNAIEYQWASLEECANVPNVGASPPRMGEYMQETREAFRELAYPIPIARDTVVKVRLMRASVLYGLFIKPAF